MTGLAGAVTSLWDLLAYIEAKKYYKDKKLSCEISSSQNKLKGNLTSGV